ncbi:MAG TPA: hypothetical protein VE325_02610 [Burkholderiales bacterium]|nr:hypothetical protein [Burkholderiales bacterium]
MKLAALALLVPLSVAAQSETRELVGQLGTRPALLVLNASRDPDGAWQLAGEYIVLPTLLRRFVDGESSPEIGVTTLREGTTAILFGRTPSAELRGTWRGGVFKGARYAPGGQERERFEFSEQFPGMDAYSAAVHCDAQEGQYKATLSYSIEAGKLQSFEWRSSVAPSGQRCSIGALQQQPLKGGLRFSAERCNVTLRELGDYVRVAAENCTEQCGSQAYLEPLLVDRRGHCRLLRGEAR